MTSLPRLPDGWRWTGIEDIGPANRPAIKAGPFGSALKKSMYVKEGYRVYGQEQVIANDFTIGDYYIDAEKFSSLATCEALPGDLLVSLVGSFGHAAIVPDGAEPGIINPRLLRIALNDKVVFGPYLLSYLRSAGAQQQLRAGAHGGTMGVLNASNLRELRVPLPPLDEQKRIAAILDKADAIRRKRKQAIALTDQLLRAIFLDMFGDPVTNPKGWPVVELGDVLADIEGGWSPPCAPRRPDADEWGVLKLGAVTYCRYDPTQTKTLVAVPPRENLEVHAGDLLFARKNTLDLLGAAAYVTATREKLMFPDLVFRLVPKPEVMPQYLWQVLTHPGIRRVVRALAGGTAGSMPNIAKSKLRSVKIPVPPKSTQSDFAARIEAQGALTETFKSAAVYADNFFDSLVQQAFEGGLSA